MGMVRVYRLLLAILSLLLLASPAFAQSTISTQPIDDSTQLGCAYTLPGGKLFCGIDYRIELVELFNNWILNEDPAHTNPAQMHPLRAELLDYMAPFSDHPAMLQRIALETKYEGLLTFEKLAVSMGSIPDLDPAFDWYSLLCPTSQAIIENRDEYNSDISNFVQALSDFVKDTEYVNWCKDHHAEYSAVVDELNAATDDAALILDALAENGLSKTDFFLTPSPMITPGRNYATVPSTDASLPLVYSFGPYKLGKEGMFLYPSWNECAISFSSREQFIQLTIHEVSHLGIHPKVEESLQGREVELSPLLTPLEPLLERGYGTLPERALTYIDEMITRARTLECFRRYLGESDFRIQLVHEVFATHGYAVFMWRYFYLENNSYDDQELFDQLLAGLPAEMKTWPDKGLDEFASYNEYSMTLKMWFQEFLPMYFEANPDNFGIVCPDGSSAEWCDGFRQLLIDRLSIPAEMQLFDNETACHYPIEVVKCDDAELLRIAAASGLDCAELTRLLEESDAQHDVAVIHMDSEPGTGVAIRWYVSADTAQLQSVVPYYFPRVTDIVVADGNVLAMDSFTSEIKLVMGWFSAD